MSVSKGAIVQRGISLILSKLTMRRLLEIKMYKKRRLFYGCTRQPAAKMNSSAEISVVSETVFRSEPVAGTVPDRPRIVNGATTAAVKTIIKNNNNN